MHRVGTRSVAPPPSAGWTRVDAAEGILLREEAGAGGERIASAVSSAPRLVRDPEPVVSLTLLLTRDPEPGESSVVELVHRGFLSLDATIAPSGEGLARLRVPDVRVVSLVPMRTLWTVRDMTDGEVLADATIEGAALRTGLLVRLDATRAVRALGALRGDDRSLELRCVTEYRTAAQAIPGITVSLDLERVYARLESALPSTAPTSDAELRGYWLSLWRAGDAAVETEDGAAVLDEAVVAGAFDGFLRAAFPILDRVTRPDGDRAYRLGRRPAGPTPVRASQRRTETATTARLVLSAPLVDVFSGVIAGSDAGAIVHLVTEGADGLPRAVPARAPVRARARDADRTIPLAAFGARASALTLASRPNAPERLTASAHLAAATAEPIGVERLPGRLNHPIRWQLDDIRISLPTHAVPVPPMDRPLPVLDDPNAPLWKDRLTPANTYYAPEFDLVSPEAGAPRDASPFLFRFRASGHDLSGTVGLEAVVRLTLRRRMSAATAAAWEAAGKPAARSVDPDGLAVDLVVPYRDDHGADQTASFPASSVTADGDLVKAEVSLADRWARVAYGALSVAGYQKDPARVTVSYRFEAYVPVREDRVRLAFGQKAASVPIRLPAPPAGGGARGAEGPLEPELETPLGRVRFEREEENGRRGPAVPGRIPLAAVAVHPQVHAPLLVATLPLPQRYGIRTQGRTGAIDALFPCATLGRFYVDASGGTEIEIGCRPAYTLGVADNRVLEEVTSLPSAATTDLRLFRSLRTPGLFVIVPKTYAIGRFSPDVAEKAYRPDVFLYSAFDAADPTRASCTVLATLVADVPAHRRLLLETEAGRLHPEARFIEPTALEAAAKFEFALPSGPGAPLRLTVDAVRLEDCLQVSAATDLAGILPLQAVLTTGGLRGAVTFALPDGSSLRCALEISMRRVVGPGAVGPVEVRREGGNVVLTDKIEQPVAVSDLVGRDGHGGVARVRVDRRLGPGESVTVAVDSALTGLVAAAEVDGAASALPEIRSFIEDIRTTVSFVNQIRFENHGLAGLAVSLRLKGLGGGRRLELPADVPLVQTDVILPLTAFAAGPVLELCFERRMADGTTTTSEWKAWDLARQGVVIGVEWTLVQ